MQAIVTRYYGPTDHCGSRVKATADAGSVTVSWQDALNAEENHAQAALALCRKLGWSGTLVTGGLPGNTGNAYVFTERVSDGKARVVAYGATVAEVFLVHRVKRVKKD